MKIILGKKIEMTQKYNAKGAVVPVTVIKAGPCEITEVRNEDKHGYQAVQLDFNKKLREFRVAKHELKKGDKLAVNQFQLGDKVKVTGISKGKGFQGVVKRHGFSGSPASHGHKDQLRMPGSIGATDAARVFKGTRMGGHMGDESVTVKNLEVVDVKPEENIMFIKGAVPGGRGGLLLISTGETNFEVENLKNMLQVEEIVAETKEEAPVEEKKEEEKSEEAPAEEKPAEATEEKKAK